MIGDHPVTFEHCELGNPSRMAERVADACCVDLMVAQYAVRRAVRGDWHGQVTFRRDRLGRVSWHYSIGSGGVRMIAPRVTDVPRAERLAVHPYARVNRRPVYERLLVVVARLIPAPERGRRIEECFDHLAAVRESGGQPRPVFRSLVVRGLIPIAFRARVDALRRTLTIR